MSDSSSSRPLVTFDGVSKRYGDVTAVHTMNLEIYEGEFLAIMWSLGRAGKPRPCGCWPALKSQATVKSVLMVNESNEISSVERDTPMVWQSLALFPFFKRAEERRIRIKNAPGPGGGTPSTCA